MKPQPPSIPPTSGGGGVCHLPMMVKMPIHVGAGFINRANPSYAL